MPNNVYIGSRYVPIFDGDWNSAKNYEGLTIVNYNGSSYTSKGPVPAGTVPTNTTYWALTGNYNGQISNLQSQIDTINNTTIPGLREDIEETKDKAIIFGNSYADYGTNKGLYYEIKSLYDDTRLYQSSGCGFLPRTGHTVTFGNLLNNAIADSNGIDHDEVTEIVILSAWGESSALFLRGLSSFRTDLTAAINSFKSTAYGAYPNLKQIRLAFVESRGIATLTVSAGTIYFNNPFETNIVLTNLLPDLGIDYLGWVSFDTLLNSTYMDNANNDAVHPNALGFHHIGSNLRAALRGTYSMKPLIQRTTIGYGITSGSTVRAMINLTPFSGDINLYGATIASGNTPAFNTDFKVLDLGGQLSQNQISIPSCFKTSAIQIGVMDCGMSQDIQDAIPVRIEYKPSGNGAFDIYGAPLKNTVTTSGGQNRHIIQNQIHFEFSEFEYT